MGTDERLSQAGRGGKPGREKNYRGKKKKMFGSLSKLLCIGNKRGT